MEPGAADRNGERPIRVLFVVGNFSVGGTERHLVEVWRRLDRNRFTLQIACFRREGRLLPEVEALKLPVRELGVGRSIYGPSGWRSLARLVLHVLRFRPDVIHGFLFGPALFAALAGRLCGVPAVVVAKRNVDAFETPRRMLGHKLAHRLATHVTAVSQHVAETAVALGVRRDRVVVIPNGVDISRFENVSPDLAAIGFRGAQETAPLIGSVGRLAARKDYGVLLDALALLAREGVSFRALLIGEGPEHAALAARVKSLGIVERVQFLGERTDVERLLPALDVFVLSSREEGIPNALLEALAAARPSIATAVGGTPEVLDDGETGWLVPPGSPEALAQALREALEHPEEARRRGEAGRRAVRERMSIEAMVSRYEAFYEHACGREVTP